MNKKAEERKKRFVDAKNAAGGLDQLIKNSKAPLRVFFNSDGVIVCVTSEAAYTPENDDWLTYDFTSAELEPLVERGEYQFKVIKHPTNSDQYILSEIYNHGITMSADDDFLYEITKSDDPDIVCTLTRSTVSIKMTEKAKKEYKEIYAIKATAKGSRVLHFYITAKSDPHTMVQYKEIKLADLILNEEVQFDTMHDFVECSIYTHKVFGAYDLTRDTGPIYGKN